MFYNIQRRMLPRFNQTISSFRCIFRRFKTTHCLDSWTVPIRATGFAEVETHFATYIKPIDPLEHIESALPDPHEYTDGTKANARVSLNLALSDDSHITLNEEFFDEFSKDIRYNPQVNIIKRQHHLIVKARPQRKFTFPAEDISLTIEVPLQFNLRIKAADDADIHINGLEGGWIYDISTEQGNCHLSSIKGKDLHVKTNSGNIISKSNLLAEFGVLEVGNSGVISVGKLQGRKFCLESDSGNVSTGPLYLQRGEVKSKTGNVSLGDIHGITEVSVQEGDISIGSLSGDLHADTGRGNITVHLSQFMNVNLKTKQGDINTTVENSQESASLNIKAKEINFSEDIEISKTIEDKGDNFTLLEAKMGLQNVSSREEKDVKIIKAEAKDGYFKMECKDWFSSLKINKQS